MNVSGGGRPGDPGSDRALRRQAARAGGRETGLALTPVRALVLRTVEALGTHPTADEVHAAVLRRRKGIGRATVYRALEFLAAAGVLTKASHTGVGVRYDARTARHHHLVCLKCDRVIDFFDGRLDAVPVPDTAALGFSVSDIQVQLRGVCRDCRETMTNREERKP